MNKKNDLNYQIDNTIYAAVKNRRLKDKISRNFFDKNKESLKRIKEIYNSKKYANKNNEKTTVDRYRKDKRNIENDWRRVNQDMWRLFKKWRLNIYLRILWIR